MFPGTLAGWAEVLERHGTRSLAQALEPAIEHARRGVPARPVVVDFIARLKHRMARFPELVGPATGRPASTTNVTVVTPDLKCADRRPPTSESAAPDIDTRAARAPPIASS